MDKKDPFTFVLFGGTGDLSMRKILPGLYLAHRDHLLTNQGRFVAVSRSVKDRTSYLKWVEEHVRPHISSHMFSKETWDSFCGMLDYCNLDVNQEADFLKLRDLIWNIDGVKVFYLATSPSLFIPICRALQANNLHHTPTRVVLEKPLGYDLQSSKQINDAVGEIFHEEQIFRIDHYLGKEPVQNLFALRFSNVLFEPLWRREWIDNIQITIAEELGVESRGDFYDKTGALRDMVQNHLLQLLSIIAMEPPLSMHSDRIRDEKLRVLRALKPLNKHDLSSVVVRGQYTSGMIHGSSVPNYHAEKGVASNSTTETFVALQVEIENWRWAGVPFFLRTGKRLADRKTEIVVNFKPVPHFALEGSALHSGANRLIIQLQPQETIRLSCLAKQPGEGMNLQSVHLDLDFEKILRSNRMEAYERLLLDVIHGRLALFVRRDEQETAWAWVEPILEAWQDKNSMPKRYAAGSWGPAIATAMLARRGTCWFEEEN